MGEDQMIAKHLAPQEAMLWEQFPENTHIAKLLQYSREMNVRLGRSGVEEQWLYHPKHRTIYVWEPDLTRQSLSYLVVILAHELGHAMDFDAHPRHEKLTRNLHWSQVPDFIERAAFVNGFLILKRLHIPLSLEHYTMMIDPAMAPSVREEIESKHLCCLLSPRQPLEPRNRRSTFTARCQNSAHLRAMPASAAARP